MRYVQATSSVMQVGDVYGRQTVLGIYQRADGYQKYARVQCQCGSAPRYVQIGQLRNGDSQSCGCLHKERVTTHGMWNTPLFNCWRGMIDRCNNPKNKRYAKYGGRGIVVCDRWLDPHVFVADMGPSFRRGMTIDRVNNDGNYSPENCRWATHKMQNRNYSRNVLVTYNGETKCLKDWAEALGINYGTLSDRIRVQKLPPALALKR